MAEWANLPEDLLQEIQSHVTSPFSTVRFRSICSSWRHSSQSNGQNPLSSQTLLPFSKRTVLLLIPSPSPSSPNPISWIIKIDQITPQRFNLYYPLSKTRVNPAQFPARLGLDMLKTRFFELGLEFSYHGSHILSDKVAFLPCEKGKKVFFLTIHVSGRLALFNDVLMDWDIVSYDCGNVDLIYDDVICFNRDFYAVDNVGRLFVVQYDVNFNVDVNVVAGAVFGGDMKRLVEMNGELMLVDVYLRLYPFASENDDGDECVVIDLNKFIVSRSMWFKVYRLDRSYGVMGWVEVMDLGKNVLFLGVNSTFSATVDELCWERGNCIVFNFPQWFNPLVEDGDDVDEEEFARYHCGGMYDLEDASISYAKVFWPPPSWATSSS